MRKMDIHFSEKWTMDTGPPPSRALGKELAVRCQMSGPGVCSLCGDRWDHEWQCQDRLDSPSQASDIDNFIILRKCIPFFCVFNTCAKTKRAP